MTLDDGLLQEAREARGALLEAEYEADRARLTYQHAIRRMHAAGGSLREIAEALGMSHQRVHQIVDAADGKTALKGSRGLVACSFCGIEQREAHKIIAGPGVYICNSCIDAAAAVVADGEPRDGIARADPAGEPCSFCGFSVGQRAGVLNRRRVRVIVERGEVRICGECVALCVEIVTEEERDPTP